jgi:hypothetical protein
VLAPMDFVLVKQHGVVGQYLPHVAVRVGRASAPNVPS